MTKKKYCVGILALVASIFFLYIVHPNNLGFSADSATYLEGANNILNGKGFSYNNGKSITHWPTLYSLCLAIVSFISGVDPLEAGKYLNSLLLAGFIIIFSGILKELKVNFYFSMLLVISILLSAPLKVFLWYLSEGLFIFLYLLCFFYVLRWSTNHNRNTLFIAGIFASLFALTRYAGIGFIVAFTVFIFSFSPTRVQEKIKNAIYYNLPILFLFVPYFFYVKLIAANNPQQTFEENLLTWNKLESYYSTIRYWFVGSFISAKLIPFLVLVYLIYLYKNSNKITDWIFDFLESYKPLIFLVLLSTGFYSLFLIVSNFYYNNEIPFDNRILFPLYPIFLLVICVFLQYIYEKNLKLLYLTTSFMLFVSLISAGLPVYVDYYNNGLGKNMKRTKDSSSANSLYEKKTQYISRANFKG